MRNGFYVRRGSPWTAAIAGVSIIAIFVVMGATLDFLSTRCGITLMDNGSLAHESLKPVLPKTDFDRVAFDRAVAKAERAALDELMAGIIKEESTFEAITREGASDQLDALE